MAVNETRDMVAEMQWGSTEGSYKSFDPDRGGLINADTRLARAPLYAGVNGYDIQNTPLPARHLPTGRWAKHTSGRGGNTV